ncbi:MAG: site-specific integrase [Saprospiraceae bacterium]|nr:site-specific integrase [Saprospiraceae bacterium]
MEAIDKMKKLIKAANKAKQIKIRLRKGTANKYSIYLDLWQDGKRNYKYLNKYIVGDKKNHIKDQETIRYIITYRDKLETELLLNDTGLTTKKNMLSNADFLEYFHSLALKRKGSTQKKWLSLYKHLITFTGGKIAIKDIDKRFCSNFYTYLNDNGNNSTPKVYYIVFKTALNQLVRDEVINSNPAVEAVSNGDVKLNQNRERQREFLSFEEIKILADTPMNRVQVKNTFIFSCFSGLRFGDLGKLTFKQINGGYLYIRQSKTQEDERMKLHPIALKIIDEQKVLQKGSDNVFTLIDNKAVNKHLRRWVEAAGISKKITFHCARHTFATLCLTNDIDIYTVSKLLGQKDLQSTQIYAKLIDKKKDEAIDKLPEL